MSFTVIARYTSPWEAHIMHALLESEGIDAHLFDEHVVGSNWLMSGAFGNVKLAVRNQQCVDAQNLLLQHQSGEMEAALRMSQHLASRRCPRCGSENLRPFPDAPDRAVQILNFAILGFFHPLPWGKFKCLQCYVCYEDSGCNQPTLL